MAPTKSSTAHAKPRLRDILTSTFDALSRPKSNCCECDCDEAKPKLVKFNFFKSAYRRSTLRLIFIKAPAKGTSSASRASAKSKPQRTNNVQDLPSTANIFPKLPSKSNGVNGHSSYRSDDESLITGPTNKGAKRQSLENNILPRFMATTESHTAHAKSPISHQGSHLDKKPDT